MPASAERGTEVERQRQEGFSLMEILVVLLIMGLIAAFVAPRLFQQVDRSRQTVANAQTQSLITALETMRLDLGRYPTAEEGLKLLRTSPSDTDIAGRWFGPYLEEEVPLDPWGNPYRYEPPSKDAAGFDLTPYVYSYGADNQPGGRGLDADVGRVRETMP